MKVKVPTSITDISLSQYLRYLKALKESEAKKDAQYIEIKTIEIFCNLSYIEVMNIEYEFVISINERIQEILKQEPKLILKFKLDGIEFGWLPKLDDMPYGELLDLINNISDWDTMVIAMGVLYRPIIKEKSGKYLVEKYKGDHYHNTLINMPMDAVVGAMVFFWNLGLDCTTYIMKYLDKEQSKTNFQNQLNLAEDGIGIQQSMNSLVGILQSMKK